MSTSPRLWAIAVATAVFVGTSATFAASPATSPAPTATGGPGSPAEQLVGASVEIARSLATVGIWLVVISFIVMIATVIVATPALKDAIKAVIDKWKVAAQLTPEDTAAPAFPYADLFRSVFGSLPDLIKTPVGVGVALILLAVVLLLGQGAIVGGFTEAGVATETPAPSAESSPGATEQATPLVTQPPATTSSPAST